MFMIQDRLALLSIHNSFPYTINIWDKVKTETEHSNNFLCIFNVLYLSVFELSNFKQNMMITKSKPSQQLGAPRPPHLASTNRYWNPSWKFSPYTPVGTEVPTMCCWHNFWACSTIDQSWSHLGQTQIAIRVSSRDLVSMLVLAICFLEI